MWREIKRILQRFHHFLVTTHINPDGDGIGASCALIELLLHYKKQVRFVCDGPIPSKLKFLDHHGLYEPYSSNGLYNQIEVVIVLDANTQERIGGVKSITQNPGVLSICIDHHEKQDCFAHYTAIDSRSCSCGAMIYALCKELGFALNRQAAEGIYTSILCDTGRFSYASTNQRAHKIAQECIKLGVDPDQMYDRLFQQLSLPHLHIFSYALQSIELHLGNRVLIQTLKTSQCLSTGLSASELEKLDLEYILEFSKLVNGVECIALLRETTEGAVRISLRATKSIDLAPLTKFLGGGGHRKASGALIKGSIEEVKQRLLEGFKVSLLTVCNR